MLSTKGICKDARGEMQVKSDGKDYSKSEPIKVFGSSLTGPRPHNLIFSQDVHVLCKLLLHVSTPDEILMNCGGKDMIGLLLSG